jgi:glycerophosphoryl diester phosphodiesterase
MTFASSQTLVLGTSIMTSRVLQQNTDLSSTIAAVTALNSPNINFNVRPFNSCPTLLYESNPFWSSSPSPFSSTTCLMAGDSILVSESDDDDSTLDINGKSLRKKLGLYTESASQRRRHFSGSIPQIVGHRGALYDYLENTREGFVKCAVDYKCDAVELDVFLLKCGTVIVFHGSGDDVTPGELTDYFVGENKNKPRSIVDLSYNDILQLQFNPNFAEFPCPTRYITDQSVAYVPTLEQVLTDLRGTGCNVKIELKGPGVVKPVVDLVEKLQMEDQCSYSSFNFDMLQELRMIRPDKLRYPSGALFDGEPPLDFIQQAIDAGATEVHLKYDVCTIDAIGQIHDAGLGSMAWLRGPIGMKDDTDEKYYDIGNEDEACYQALIDTGVQQICCNKPNFLSSMLTKLF